MTTARSQRQRELSREIERHWRRRRTRQISFVVAGASFLCAFFLLGRAIMPLVPPAGEDVLEKGAEESQSAEPLTEAEPMIEPAETADTEDAHSSAGDGGMSFSFLIASALLGSIGGIALGIARIFKSEDEETGGM